MIDPNQPAVQETTRRQGRAAAPDRSVWVSANAGSGKTHVLTQRVIRLLMGGEDGRPGADPSKIVCITYTKAAAAEMERRLLGRLSDWALADDETLRDALAGLASGPLSDDRLAGVRRLFAQALETPGGLKIQTIHSFCEGILRRFPVEAGLLPGFTVMDDGEMVSVRTRLLSDLAAQAALGDEALGSAFRRLQERGSDAQRDKALLLLMDQMPDIERAVTAAGGHDGFIAALRSHMGVPDGAGPEEWRAAALDRMDRGFVRAMERALPSLEGKHAARAEAALALFDDAPATDRFDLMASVWLNKGYARPKPFRTNAALRAAIPDFTAQSEAFLDCLCEAIDAERAAAAFADTLAYYTLGFALYEQYTAYKDRAGRLDYADLIAKVAHLMETTSGAWVLYKLDQGIDHLLLDEAQDTGGLQWSVIDKFREEFFAGLSDGRERSFFVVGDKKQSIYSFQGADASLFDRKRMELGEAIPEGGAYEEVPLFLSFRSASAILEVADRLFEGEAGQGVHDGEAEAHASAKPSAYGRVELWPLVPPLEEEKGNPWDVPVDMPAPEHPTRRLAHFLCEEIKGWLDRGERLEGPGRPITPGDILILCQKRGQQFHEILRALSQFGIPMAGADRVSLKEDVAVRDFLALLRFAANHYDDLSLAEALKSPLWALSEDDLFTLAHDRGGRSLWSRVLGAARGTVAVPAALKDRCALVVQEIERAEEAGARAGPFAFLSSFLEMGGPTGRRRFRARLGAESDEAIDELLNEALDFELKAPRTLEGFLAHLETLDTDVKKEADEGSDTVRLMTVHGAKGLEAPIVILADCGAAPTKPGDSLFPLMQPTPGGVLDKRPGYLVAALGGKDQLPPNVAEAREAALTREYEEYRRKLYVAATRAEERLYLCGVVRGRASQNAPVEKPVPRQSWYGLAERAFGGIKDRLSTRACPWAEGEDILLLESGQRSEASSAAVGAAPQAMAAVTPPDWLFAPVPEDQKSVIQFPSAEGGPAALSDRGPVRAPRARLSEEAIDPRERGILIHALLELLPGLPTGRREEAAAAFLAARAPDWPEEERRQAVGQVMGILNDPAFGQVFAPGSRAEVAVHGMVGGQRYSGQIDRLFVGPDCVLVVDYKTHRTPVLDPAALPSGIVGQLRIYAALAAQLYPGRKVEAAVLWTDAPALVQVPEEMLGPL